ncbi:MAG: tol-pal system-associated acyl-CoA thioesterase [Giesbergeria sp.]|uniref:tol-pal system-associated acyl-CoA thioesterase n=1 Tax=Giesbergeria sp. TaxID=2818473 RepID=UPI0026208C3F|nr:tol-pal system-associated acyl-CoA thioesterase [Giesbergeria sp.]MDD2609541.1 tol-pal system-associated acyl-CoA thioesterase [Giesbergeria sp.]
MATTFQLPIRIYWEDTDAGGIVFHANYLKFFERARTEWLRSLGLEQQTLRVQIGGLFVVSEMQLRYLAPARLDDALVVTAQLQAAGRASLTLLQEAFLRGSTPDASAQLLSAATVRIGWVDAQTMRPTRIPGPLLEKISPCFNPHP